MEKTSEETPQLFPTDSELMPDFLVELKLTLGKGVENRIRDSRPAIAARFSRNLGTQPLSNLLRPSRAKGFSGQIQATQNIAFFGAYGYSWRSGGGQMADFYPAAAPSALGILRNLTSSTVERAEFCLGPVSILLAAPPR